MVQSHRSSGTTGPLRASWVSMLKKMMPPGTISVWVGVEVSVWVGVRVGVRVRVRVTVTITVTVRVRPGLEYP